MQAIWYRFLNTVAFTSTVSPAKAGAQSSFLDPGIRRGDGGQGRPPLKMTGRDARPTKKNTGTEATV